MQGHIFWSLFMASCSGKREGEAEKLNIYFVSRRPYPLLFLRDSLSGARFLVDRRALVSVFPLKQPRAFSPSSTSPLSFPPPFLTTAGGHRINSYGSKPIPLCGSKTIPLCFNSQRFMWDFIQCVSLNPWSRFLGNLQSVCGYCSRNSFIL